MRYLGHVLVATALFAFLILAAVEIEILLSIIRASHYASDFLLQTLVIGIICNPYHRSGTVDLLVDQSYLDICEVIAMEINIETKGLSTFFIDVVIGTVIFAILLLPVWGLDVMADFLAEQGIDFAIILALTVLEYALFVIDVALLVIFLGRNTTHLVRRHWHFDKVHEGI